MVDNIKWLKSLQSFNRLEHFEQLHLLKNCWKELFLLSAVGENFSTNLSELVNSLGLSGSLDKLNNGTISRSNGHHDSSKKDQTNHHPKSVTDSCSSPPIKKSNNGSGNDRDIKANSNSIAQSNDATVKPNDHLNDRNPTTNLNDKHPKGDQKAPNGIRSIISILMNDDDKVKSESKKSNGDHLNSSSIDSMMSLLVEIRNFHQLIVSAKELSIDFNEITCLKLMCVFKVNALKGVDIAKITSEQENSQLMLRNYLALKLSINSVDPNAQTIRFGQLMFILASMNSISETAVEQLFFRKTIGTLSVVNLIDVLFTNPNHLESFA